MNYQYRYNTTPRYVVKKPFKRVAHREVFATAKGIPGKVKTTSKSGGLTYAAPARAISLRHPYRCLSTGKPIYTTGASSNATLLMTTYGMTTQKSSVGPGTQFYDFPQGPGAEILNEPFNS